MRKKPFPIRFDEFAEYMSDVADTQYLIRMKAQNDGYSKEQALKCAKIFLLEEGHDEELVDSLLLCKPLIESWKIYRKLRGI